MRTSLAKLACLLMLAGVVQGCGLLQRPTVKVTGASLRNVSFNSAILQFAMDVHNPYDVSLPLRSIDYALTSNGKRFVDGNTWVRGDIPPKSTESMQLPVRIDFIELAKAIGAARPGQAIPYSADLGLTVQAPVVGELRVPASRAGEFVIPSLPGSFR